MLIRKELGIPRFHHDLSKGKQTYPATGRGGPRGSG